MAGQTKRLSLDTNFVFDLAAEEDFAHDLLERLQGKGYALFLPPTAVHELHLIFSEGDEPAERKLAGTALTSLRQWDIRPFDLDSAAEAVCKQFVRGLLHKRLIPEEEFNDGLIMAESSLEDIPMLVTSDKHLLDIDGDALLLAFNDADLPSVHPVHPRRLLRVLR